MKSNHSEASSRYMVLVKIDATNLFDRINERKSDYLEMFSLKRDRDIFKSIFRSRFSKSTLFDLSHLPLEVIEVSNDFYTEVDRLFWYLMHTQDMPNTIEDEIIRYLHIIRKKFDVLTLYVDAELSGTTLEHIQSDEDLSSISTDQVPFLFEEEQ